MPVEVPKSGIPPSGQAPQNDNVPSNSNAQPNQPSLIAGKYKSVDEAIVASEQGFHKVSEQLAGLTRVLEGALTAPPPNYGYQGVPVGQGGYNGYDQRADPYGRAPQIDQIDPAAFITNPSKFLQERDDKLAGRIINQVADTVRDTVSNALAVADFKINHPEMKKHEMIVRSFLTNTDARKPMAQRLEDAATLTTNYLQANGMVQGQQPNSSAPQGNSYVESPQNNGQGSFQFTNQAPAQSSDETDLAEYIRERNADFSAKFGITPPKN